MEKYGQFKTQKKTSTAANLKKVYFCITKEYMKCEDTLGTELKLNKKCTRDKPEMNKNCTRAEQELNLNRNRTELELN